MTTTAPPASGPQAARPPTEGERWAADALTTLRAAAFAPAAVIRFVQESLGRAADTRTRRRGLARQAQRWSITGAGTMLALREALSRRGVGTPSRSTLVTWCAIQTAMLEWHLGMVEGVEGDPRDRLSAADALTLGRGALAPFAAAAPPDGEWFLLLLAAAGGSDLLDGRLAQRDGPTRFGRDFDPLADLAFRAASVRGAARAEWLTPAAVRALAARQLLLAAGAAWHWFARSQRPPQDAARLARWDAPPLLTGLALGAVGQPTRGSALVILAAAVGTTGLMRAHRAGTQRLDA